MKRALLSLFVIACIVAGMWGYAFEAFYFGSLGLDVHKTLSPQHYIASGLSNVLPMLGIALVLALITKFFSRNVARDDLKAFKEGMQKTAFAQEISIARVAFVVSLVYLLLVALDVRTYNGMSLGYMFWLLSFINMQCFVGAMFLSPPHSRAAVSLAFVLSVAMCFAAGGLGLARDTEKSASTLRDDFFVKVERVGPKLVATPKTVKIPVIDRILALWPTSWTQ